MKRLHVAGLAFVVLAFAVTASAQNSTSQFVVGGETAKKMHDFSTINLATAERIAEAVLTARYGQERVGAQQPFVAAAYKGYWIVEGSFETKAG